MRSPPAWSRLLQTHLQRLSLGLPRRLSWLIICPQCRRPGFDACIGKIPWRRERLLTPVFWPGELHGMYSPWGHKESDMTERLSLSLGLRAFIPFLGGARGTPHCTLVEGQAGRAPKASCLFTHSQTRGLPDGSPLQSNRQDVTGHNEIRNPDGDEKVLGREPDALRASARRGRRRWP